MDGTPRVPRRPESASRSGHKSKREKRGGKAAGTTSDRSRKRRSSSVTRESIPSTDEEAVRAHIQLLLESLRASRGGEALKTAGMILRLLQSNAGAADVIVEGGAVPIFLHMSGPGRPAAAAGCDILGFVARSGPEGHAAVLEARGAEVAASCLTIETADIDPRTGELCRVRPSDRAGLAAASAACRLLRSLAVRRSGALDAGRYGTHGLLLLACGSDTESRLEAGATLSAIVAAYRKVGSATEEENRLEVAEERIMTSVVVKCVPIFSVLLTRGAASRPTSTRTLLAEYAAWGLASCCHFSIARRVVVERALGSLVTATQKSPARSPRRRAALTTLALLASDPSTHELLVGQKGLFSSLSTAAIVGDARESACATGIVRSVTATESTRDIVWKAVSGSLFDVASGRQGVQAQCNAVVTLASFAGYEKWKRDIVDGAARTLGEALIGEDPEVAAHAARAIRNLAVDTELHDSLLGWNVPQALGTFLSLSPDFVRHGRRDALAAAKSLAASSELRPIIFENILPGLFKALATSSSRTDAETASKTIRVLTTDSSRHELMARLGSGITAAYLRNQERSTINGRFNAVVILSCMSRFPVAADEINELAVPAIGEILQTYPVKELGSKQRANRFLLHSINTIRGLTFFREYLPSLAEICAPGLASATRHALESNDRRLFTAIARLTSRLATDASAVRSLRKVGLNRLLSQGRSAATPGPESTGLERVLTAIATPTALSPDEPVWGGKDDEDDDGHPSRHDDDDDDDDDDSATTNPNPADNDDDHHEHPPQDPESQTLEKSSSHPTTTTEETEKDSKDDESRDHLTPLTPSKASPDRIPTPSRSSVIPKHQLDAEAEWQANAKSDVGDIDDEDSRGEIPEPPSIIKVSTSSLEAREDKTSDEEDGEQSPGEDSPIAAVPRLALNTNRVPVPSSISPRPSISPRDIKP